MNLLQRWAHKIRIDSETGCWIWLGAKDEDGYGLVSNDGNGITRTHIYAYTKKYGKIPFGLVLDHIVCSNTSCCNPDHVQPATRKQNALRSLTSPTAINARKTHCPQGHEYTQENTHINTRGSRVCRECLRLKSKKYRRINGITVKRRQQDGSPPE